MKPRTESASSFVKKSENLSGSITSGSGQARHQIYLPKTLLHEVLDSMQNLQTGRRYSYWFILISHNGKFLHLLFWGWSLKFEANPVKEIRGSDFYYLANQILFLQNQNFKYCWHILSQGKYMTVLDTRDTEKLHKQILFHRFIPLPFITPVSGQLIFKQILAPDRPRKQATRIINCQKNFKQQKLDAI